jgi:hypothetical protein
MVEEINELKIKIAQFYKLLDSVPDKPSSSLEFISFLRTFLRVKSEASLPTIEVMTVLKKSKPVIFTTLRQKVNQYEMLQILLELSMEENEADHHLKSLLNM